MSLDYNFWADEPEVAPPAPVEPPVEVPKSQRRHLMTDAEWSNECVDGFTHPQNKDPYRCMDCGGCHEKRVNRSRWLIVNHSLIEGTRDGVLSVSIDTETSVCVGPAEAPHPETLVQPHQPCPVCHRNGYPE